MIYREWKGSDGFLIKARRNKTGFSHRDSGPAQINYYTDGSIKYESFCKAGNFLGEDKEGFWKLWKMLTEVERQSPGVLKCLARYS